MKKQKNEFMYDKNIATFMVRKMHIRVIKLQHSIFKQLKIRSYIAGGYINSYGKKLENDRKKKDANRSDLPCVTYITYAGGIPIVEKSNATHIVAL